jgi:hypothetical protein
MAEYPWQQQTKQNRGNGSCGQSKIAQSFLVGYRVL